MSSVTTASVWREIEQHLFGCLAFVNPAGAPRTAGVVYIVRDRRMYVSTARDSWKARHIATNPNVAMTVTIPKRVPFMPWIRIPEATISFHGKARVLAPGAVSPAVLHDLLHGREADTKLLQSLCVLEVAPDGYFATYGVGVTLMQMRDQQLARGRVPV